ncbi:hypothetical protein [Anabaena sp. UHCC 0399]|uniref:hypothetical protein n=1 Tax=Anabaena sp. UHCC 0399 TaxID=3110238 RepID=UPI002B20F8B2|nr:hypothetical protein [Anabaena sp. UHCC 0399]MEA5567767.1 hypothetical protein [Anabaena sp. UHCC 0399]
MAQKDCDKRPNYFAGQYLLEDDFELEQSYHIDRQRRHNRLLHVSGIADGLNVKPEGDLTVKISAGTAIDKNGQMIVWSADMENEPVKLQDVNNNNAIANGKYILLIEYFEKELSNSLQEGTTDGYTRWYELPNFKLVPDGQPLPEDFIALAKLSIDGKTVTIDNADKNIRQYSGLRLPSTNQTNAPTLRSGGDNASNLAVLSGDLSVRGSLSVTGKVGVGTTSPTEKLEISGGNLKVNGNISATDATLTGKVGIGTTSPSARLTIQTPDLYSGNTIRFEAKQQPSLYYLNLNTNVTDGVVRWVFDQKNLTTTHSNVLAFDRGNVGIGTATPTEKLEVTGIIKAKAYQVTTQIAGGKDEDALRNLQTKDIYKQPQGWKPTKQGEDSNTSVWQPFPDLKQEITLSATATILVFYNISIPSGRYGTYIVTRLKINDKIVTRTICTNTTYTKNTDLWFGELSSGKHSITVEIRTDASSLTSNTQIDDWQNRVLRVLIFGT